MRRAADRFLSSGRIAVAGVSRDAQQAANHVYRKLRAAGLPVVAVNPAASRVEGDPCHPSLDAVPGGVDALFIAAPPAAAAGLVRDCIRLGIRHVWMHRSFGTGSVSEEALRLAREAGLSVIAGGCPMMVVEPVDPAHRCMAWLLRVTGRLPKDPPA